MVLLPESKRRSIMTKNRGIHLFAGLAIVASLALVSASSLLGAGDFVYADTTATLSYTTFVGPTPIPGLALTLPPANATFNTAVVTLSMPNLFLSLPTSNTPMSATLQLVAPFSPQGVVSAFGGIGCDTTGVSVSGLKPFTMVIKVPLGTTTQPVEAEWASNGSSTVTTQTFASISAILVKD
jgi:hypothetical protein